ncbi:MAG: hypothetical protein E7337_13370 [Clostridiales bacterium]|nr:hypothetical protein [Clostridiales bacterium]
MTGLIKKCLEILADKAPVGQVIQFDIDDTDKQGYMKIEKDYNRADGQYLKIDVADKGSDRLTGYYFHHADSPEEMKVYLKDAKTVDEVLKGYMELCREAE